jgi:hypothetical protein
MGFFLIVFCVSGILLNHRHAISGIDVSRGMLPSRYEIKQWNSGLLRGTCRMDDGRVAVYGSAGVFLTDTVASSFVSMNEGLPQGADMRQIRGMAGVSYGAGQKSSHEFFAVSQYGLYRTDGRHRWHHVALPTGEEERLTDVTSRGDTLVVLSRSYAYVATAPYKTFRRVEIPAPSGYDGKVSLFRTVWLFHSGELFGEKTVSNFNFADRNLADRSNLTCAQDTMSVENKFDYGIAAGLGMELALPRVGHFLLEGRYYYGLGNIYGDSKRDYFARSNHSNIVIKLTYLFDIVKTK